MVDQADQPEDDPSIGDDWRMLRRIPPGWVSRYRPESSNFEIRSQGEGLSIVAWIEEEDLPRTLSEEPAFGVVVVSAGELRAAGYAIVKVPLDGNPNHCECYGSPTHGQRRQLAKAARWASLPQGAEPDGFGALEAF